MYSADSPRPSGRKRFAAIAAAVAVGATALVGAVSLQSASAAEKFTPSECTSNTSEALVQNPFNAAEKFLPRHCTIAETRANVLSKDVSDPTFLNPRVQIGYANANEEQVVYCQKASKHLNKGNPWWVLTKPDTDTDGSGNEATAEMTAASTLAKDTGWVSAVRFKERYVDEISALPVPGVPNCEMPGELAITDLSGDTLAEYQAKHPTTGNGNGNGNGSSNQTTNQPASYTPGTPGTGEKVGSKCVAANKNESYNGTSFQVQTCTTFTYRTSLDNRNYVKPALFSFNSQGGKTQRETIEAGSINVVCQLDSNVENPVTYNKATNQRNANKHWLLVADKGGDRWVPATQIRQGAPGAAIPGANGEIAACPRTSGASA